MRRKVNILILDGEKDGKLIRYIEQTMKMGDDSYETFLTDSVDGALGLMEKNDINMFVIDSDVPKGVWLISEINKRCKHAPIVTVGSQGEEDFYCELLEEDEAKVDLLS